MTKSLLTKKESALAIRHKRIIIFINERLASSRFMKRTIGEAINPLLSEKTMEPF